MKLSFNTYQPIIGKFLRMGILAALLLAGCTGGGIYHRVEPGQTLYRISHAYDIDEIYLARVNGITDPTQLQVGTPLYIPGASSPREISTVPQTDQVEAPSAPVSKTPRKTASASDVMRKIPPPSAINRPQSTTTSNKIKLLWPLKGEVVRTFGATSKVGGKGLEIAVPEKSEVKASAAGKVIYSGDGVKGYGHLIIVQHENDFYTVYGFNSRNLVGQGAFVSQGEKIALSGVPPGGGKPRLHFEVRQKKVAVNPILYLP